MPILAHTVDVPLKLLMFRCIVSVCLFSNQCEFVCCLVLFCFVFLLLMTCSYYSLQGLLVLLFSESSKGLGAKCSGVMAGTMTAQQPCLQPGQTLRCNVRPRTLLQDQAEPRLGPKLSPCLLSTPSLSCFPHFPLDFSWDRF